MKRILKSLRFRMVLPVVAMTLVIVTLLTALFSRAFTRMIMQQEQEVNAVGFETISHTITPLIDSSVLMPIAWCSHRGVSVRNTAGGCASIF